MNLDIRVALMVEIGFYVFDVIYVEFAAMTLQLHLRCPDAYE